MSKKSFINFCLIWKTILANSVKLNVVRLIESSYCMQYPLLCNLFNCMFNPCCNFQSIPNFTIQVTFWSCKTSAPNFISHVHLGTDKRKLFDILCNLTSLWQSLNESFNPRHTKNAQSFFEVKLTKSWLNKMSLLLFAGVQ